MKWLIVMIALVGCETSSTARREAEVWVRETMTQENQACLAHWEAEDPDAARAWITEAASAKASGDYTAMGRSLDKLECMCGTSRFLGACDGGRK